jgi:hypothetical protein
VPFGERSGFRRAVSLFRSFPSGRDRKSSEAGGNGIESNNRQTYII